MKKRQKYILFDFDGTICDARSFIFSSIVELFDRLEFQFSRKKVKSLMGLKIKHMLKELRRGDDYEFFRKKLSSILMQKVSRDAIKPCVPLDSLFVLKKQGYRFIIVTNNYEKYVRKCLKILGVESLFEAIYSSEDLEMNKIEIFEMLLGTLDLKGNETLYVGDRFTDVRSAKAVGMVSVAIHNKSSWSSRNEILAEEPDFIINDFEDLEEIVRSV